MAKEYLKMADGFKGGAKWFGDALREETGAADELINSAVHAIDSHDELVAEVERLRGAIHDAFIDGCQVGWDMTGEGYNAEYGGPDDGRLCEEFSAIFTERYTDKMSLA